MLVSGAVTPLFSEFYMIANIVLVLLILGIFPLWKLHRRYDNIIVSISFLLVSALFFYFIRSWQTGTESSFLMLWDSSASGDIKISVNSTLLNYAVIFPFFVVAVVSLFNNLFFRYEKKKRAFSSLIILMLFSFIMLISGDNFIQVITFVFVIDILSQMLIQDVYAGRRYGIYNLAADMGLFLVFALMHGKLQNLDMESLAEYPSLGNYQILMAAVVLISLLIKFGFFIFHSYLLDLKSARFHRLILIPYLSTPAVSLILLFKMRSYLVEYESFCFVFNLLLMLTVLWGAAGAVIMKNLKEKSIYFSMMIMAVLAKLAETGTTWNLSFSWLFICGFLFNICIYYLHYYTNRENAVVFSGCRTGCGLLAKYVVLAASVMVTAAFILTLFSFRTEINSVWIWGYSFLFLLAEANMFSQQLQENTVSLFSRMQDYRPLPVLILTAVLSFIAAYNVYPIWQPGVWSIILFALLLWLKPVRRVLKDQYCDSLQKADFFSGFYNAVIARPVKFVGRILTLLVDFVFLEKTLVSTVMLSAGIIIRSFRQINREGALRYFLFVLTSFLILAVFFLRSRI